MQIEAGEPGTEAAARARQTPFVTGQEWFAISVRSRHEFVARDELERKGLEAFLPVFTRLQQWRDRKKQVLFPVFPGYLFVRVFPQPEEFMQVIKTRGTVGLICLEPGRPTPIAPQEIEALQTVTAGGQSFDVYPGYQIGSRVRIRRGPLQGAEGVLAKREGVHLFFVNVEILGRSVGIRICADDIEAL